MQPISLKTVFARLFDAMDRRDSSNAWVVSGCAPTAFGIGSLRVDVAAGSVVPAGGAFTAFAGGNKTPAAAVVNAHVDLIYIDNAGVLQIGAGAEAALNPVPPALPAGATAIALVFVPPGAVDYTAATTAYIFDVRQFKAPMFLPDGSVGAPSLPFGNELTLGLYRASAGVLGVSGAISLSGTPATSGTIRLGNAQSATFRNAANSANVIGLNLDSSNVLNLVDGNVNITLSGDLAAASTLRVGGTPAASGIIRISNNQIMKARNAANSADITLIGTDSSNNILLGPITTAGDLILGGASGIATRLAKGSDGNLLGVVAGTVQWTTSTAALSSSETSLGSDNTPTPLGTYVDIISLSLAAGTWLLIGQIQAHFTAQARSLTAKLWDGTTVKASCELGPSSGAAAMFLESSGIMTGIVSPGGTTTYKISAVNTGGAADSVVKAAAISSGAGNNATRLVAVKIA